AIEAQSASLSQSLTPAVIPYASIDVRNSTMTASPTTATLCGLPPMRCCQRAALPAIGSLVLTHAQTWGQGFHTPVVASTITITIATSAYPFQGLPPDAM